MITLEEHGCKLDSLVQEHNRLFAGSGKGMNRFTIKTAVLFIIVPAIKIDYMRFQNTLVTELIGTQFQFHFTPILLKISLKL